MIPVTKTFLPPIDEYQAQIKRIWENRWLTNRGELVRELEEKLKDKFDTEHFFCLNNGTIPIQIALKMYGKGGEIITTPFSYVATTSAILWENCKPVFVDIDPLHFTIDETKIEAAITPQTTCILATHVYGNPCNIEEIERIAKKHGLHVIYDAAHCFGVEYQGKSIFHFGNVSTCSFHATKIYHCGEGGGIFLRNEQDFLMAFRMHNFGHNGPTDFELAGINGKISELQAAMGLSVLPHFDSIFEARKKCVEAYIQQLDNNTSIQLMKIRSNTTWNYSYFPVVFDTPTQREKVEKALNVKQIFPRRYFYPSLSQLDFLPSKFDTPIANYISERVLCLPLYADLEIGELHLICETLIAAL